MKDIYINARFLTQRITGVQRFAVEMSKQLKLLLPGVKFVAPKNIIQKELADYLNVETYGHLKSHLWEQLELPIFLKKKNSPLLLNFGNTGPMMYKNSIVTIHDLSIFLFPQAYSKKFYYTYKFLIPTIIKNALKVITVSHGAKETIIEMINLSERKIEVIYNGASHIPSQSTSIERINNPYGKYILAVASFNPIKNLPALLKAFENVTDKDFKLVVVGNKQKSFNNQKFEGAALNNDKIIFTGHIDNLNELINLYRCAEIFVSPSVYESFGIPNLEAMTCGCPVITSSAGSLPEICGDAALYVDPNNISDITEKINILLGNETLQNELIEKGNERIRLFNWESSAKQLVNILENIK